MTKQKLSLLAVLVIGVVHAQDSPAPALRKGVSVQLAVAPHAVEMRAADQADATVVAITADGKVYVGTDVTQPAALGSLKPETVYVKADSRVPYQQVLAVLDALRGKSVVLLTSAPANAEKAKLVPPYGIKVVMPR